MSLEEVTLDPDKQVVRGFILHAVNQQINTPVENAFDGDWPVHLSVMETKEVVEAIKNTPPRRFVPFSKRRKEMALKEVQETRVKEEDMNNHMNPRK